MAPTTTGADIVRIVGEEWVALMQQGRIPMFQHLYYETAGGDLRGDPLDKLYEAIYALRQDIGAVSGRRAGFEQWLAEYGPRTVPFFFVTWRGLGCL